MLQPYLELIEEQLRGDREFYAYEIPWGLLNQDVPTDYGM